MFNLIPVDIPIDDSRKFGGLYGQPEKSSKGSILLIQEIFGLNRNMQVAAEEYVKLGYHVLMPDLFWRMTPGLRLDPSVEADRSLAMDCNKRFDDITGLTDLHASIKQLRSLTKNEKVVSIGYCLGGRLSFALGALGSVTSAVSFYGVNLEKYFTAEHMSPTLVHLADQDTLCSEAQRESIIEYGTKNKNVEVELHKGVGHAFMRKFSPAFALDATEQAMSKTLAFIEKEN